MNDRSIEWRLPPERAGRPAPEELARRRAAIPATTALANRAEIGGVPCMIVGEGAGGEGAVTLLYVHGGGYRMGTADAWAGFAARLAAAAGARVLLPDYRLAPEHPFPAALRDAVAVYEALLKDAARVVVAGDSAGGGLAAALCIAAHAAGAPAPAGAVLLSPMLDLEAGDETYASRRDSDRFFSRQAVIDCAALYLQGHPPADPLASPLHGAAAAFPPTMLLAGGDEVLLGEALALARRLALGQRRVTLHVAPGMGHVWPMLAAEAPEADAAIAAIGGFVRAPG